MRQILDENAAIILQTRVNIAQAAKIFTHVQIAREWGMSTATLYRYARPEYRELSRETERNQRLKEQKKDRTKCQKCGQAIHSHSRCLYCTILLHETKCDCEQRLTAIQRIAFDV